MAHPDVDLATGASLVFTSTSWSAQFVNIEWTGLKREAIDTSHLGSSAYRTFMPSDLVDPGELKGELHYNADNPPPFTHTGETVRLKYPLYGTETTNAYDQCSMFITGFDKTLPLEGKQVANITLKCSGPISQADAA